jgi:WD40 repeat protein
MSRLSAALLISCAFACGAEPRLDLHGDPLPEGAVARLGSLRYRLAGSSSYSVALSPDGKMLAVGASAGLTGSSITLFEANTGRVLRRLPGHAHVVRGLAFSPDGKLLASGGGDGRVALWDLQSGRELWRVESGGDSLAFFPDGKVLAAEEGRGVRLFDVNPVRRGLLLEGHTDRVMAVAVAPDGKSLASAAMDGTVRVWDAAAGKERLRLNTPPKYGLALAYSPDGKALACATFDGRLLVWDAASGRERWAVQSPDDALQNVVFAPDGSELYTARGTVRAWDAATGKELRHAGVGGQDVFRLALSPDGRLLYGIVRDGVVRLWETKKMAARAIPDGHAAGVQSLAVAADGRTVATADGVAVRLWDAATGRQRHRIAAPGSQHVAFAPDGRSLAASGAWGAVTLWDAATGERRGPDFKASAGGPVAFLGDKWLASATLDARIEALEVASGRRGPHVFEAEVNRVTSTIGTPVPFVVAPDGRTVAAPTQTPDPAPVQLWDALSGEKKAKTALPGRPLAFSPDGALLALATADGLALVSTRSGEPVRACADAGPGVRSAAFSPDGWELAGGMAGGEVRIWEVATGGLRRSHEGHSGPVLALAYLPDGRLVSGSADQTALVWEAWPAPPAERLSARDLAGLWDDLAGADAARAARAVRRLQGDPERAVAALGERVRPVAADERQVARLVADLGSEDFATREKAQAALEALGGAALRPLERAAADDRADVETRRRAAAVVAQLLRRQDTPDGWRERRGVEALERIGTAEARALLRRLAGGADGALLTETARAALRRLERGGP